MEKEELLELIKELYGISECNQLILNQIYKFITECGYSYKDIARALVFYIEVQGQKPQLKYGIGIVPHVMREATKYFEQLKQEQERQIKDAQIAKNNNETVIITCKLPIESKHKKRKQINIEDL